MMRNKTNELGYKLNEHGLYDIEVQQTSLTKKKNITIGIKLDTPDEESVFHLLGMDYIEPTNR